MKIKVIAAIAALIVVIGGFFVYNTVLREPEQASGPVEAVPVSAGGDARTFQIVSEESEARFIINEVLNGTPTTVVGVTKLVAGQIAIDPNDPSKSQIGVIQVNARDLTTDNSFRNRTIKNNILKTNQHEFVTFTPTAISGLPTSGQVGQTYNFQITGDLTIAGVTKSVTFEASVVAESEQRVVGTAHTTVQYADFNITIPKVPQVASVDPDVRLEINFVATPA